MAFFVTFLVRNSQLLIGFNQRPTIISTTEVTVKSTLMSEQKTFPFKKNQFPTNFDKVVTNLWATKCYKLHLTDFKYHFHNVPDDGSSFKCKVSAWSTLLTTIVVDASVVVDVVLVVVVVVVVVVGGSVGSPL